MLTNFNKNVIILLKKVRTINKEQKIEFVNGLMENLKQEIIANVEKMPEDWDVWELRQYISDKASDCVWKDTVSTYKKRKYNNARLRHSI